MHIATLIHEDINKLRALKKTNRLICKCCLSRVKDGVDEFWMKANSSMTIPELIYMHYGKHSVSYFQAFFDEWKDHITNFIWAYTVIEGRVYILGLAMLINGTWTDGGVMFGHREDVYVRCLCSACGCGSDILRYLKKKYDGSQYTRVRLHSEPDRYVIAFYERHGFVMLTETYMDIWGIVYPVMVFSFSSLEDLLLRPGEQVANFGFFPGVMYYVFKGVACVRKWVNNMSFTK